MMHTKRMKTRAIHQSMHYFGISLLFLGLLFIVAHKVEFKKTLLPVTVHSFIAFVSLGILCLQSISGTEKMSEFQKSITPRKIRRWHGDSGLLLWDLLSLTLLTGLISFFGLFSRAAVVPSMCTLLVWLATHAQMRRKSPEEGAALMERVASNMDLAGDDADVEGSPEDP